MNQLLEEAKRNVLTCSKSDRVIAAKHYLEVAGLDPKNFSLYDLPTCFMTKLEIFNVFVELKNEF